MIRPPGSRPRLERRHTLVADGVTLAYDDRVVVDGLTLNLPAEGVTMIVGANGCGKSTLLRALARLLAPKSGAVLLDGADIRRLPTKAVARVVGLLPQSPMAPEGVTVGSPGNLVHHLTVR